jgi:hypothetical protein
MPFEARLDADGRQRIRWSCSDLKPPMLLRAAELFSDGMTVREVAVTLRISKSEAGRLRIRASEDGLLSTDEEAELESPPATIQDRNGSSRRCGKVSSRILVPIVTTK